MTMLFEETIPKELAKRLASDARKICQDEDGDDAMTHVSNEHLLVSEPVPQRLLGQGSGLVAKVCREMRKELAKVLAQRKKDRAFIDQRMRACAGLNAKLGRKLNDESYGTIFGQRDADGRVVIGPITDNFAQPSGKQIEALPEFLKGEHVTVFGLADSAEGCQKALCAHDARLASEPACVEKILATTDKPPRWGVDFEDSQTPLRDTIETANANLSACFQRKPEMTQGSSSPASLSQAFKRLPGLALPCTYVFQANSEPVPFHILELALHILEHWDKPEALVFYMPKLENEEEAAYLAHLIQTVEREIKAIHTAYVIGTVRVLVVLENPRAIFRANEIADALHPYFAGASLGWHDYLAATARLYKEDPNFRIPVKADTTIVLKHVKASHELVSRVIGGRGGLPIGGMYGVLPLSWDTKDASLQIALRGLFKDIVTQLRRGLTGFWLADPRYVRVATAIALTWDKDMPAFEQLVKETLLDKIHQEEILAFAQGQDPAGPVEVGAPNFARSLVVANVAESAQVANNDPEEIRYNIFQSLQYLADWLAGNGCVGLPARVDNVQVLVLDDLATIERSRWELWAEIHHGRFPIEDFLRIAHEELNAIRRGKVREGKLVHVEWSPKTAKWYPVAMELLLKFVCDAKPVEFVTELLYPFTVDRIRTSENPWEAAAAFDAVKYAMQDPYAKRFHYFFERCGAMRFARTMAKTVATDMELAERVIRSFNLEEVIESAGFHGDIGQGAGKLDKLASAEQAKVFASVDDNAENARLRLCELGAEYIAKFGVKFLVSAKGKSAQELLDVLENRINNSAEQELENAREALWQITMKRLIDEPTDDLLETIESLRKKHEVAGASFCLNGQPVCFGDAHRMKAAVKPDTMFEIASLSKTIGSAFAIEYFGERNISLNTPVNDLLEKTTSTFRIRHSKYGDKVLLWHLMSHSALNMHYVNGVPLDETMPDTRDFLEGNERYGYPPIDVVGKPGSLFQYSGGGFLVLQHLIEQLEGGDKSIDELTRPFLQALGIEHDITFAYKPENSDVACGYDDIGCTIKATRKMFPAFAAGALGTPRGMTRFLDQLGQAYRNKEGCGPISHDTAIKMLHGTDKGCRDFMGVLMGLGVFVGEAGPNRFAIHQGANDGYRAIYIHCFDGPNAGEGITAFANGDNRAMFFIAESCQAILRLMNLKGVDVSKFPTSSVDINQIPQEEIVNFGYKNLVFVAFEPTLPSEIIDQGPVDPLATANLLVGSTVERVSDQRFARACQLGSDHLPKFDPELFCPMGKVMDSWETARHNPEEYDFAIFALARPGRIRYISISTKYHLGNQAEYVRISGKCKDSDDWIVLVPKTHLDGHAEKRVLVPDYQSAILVDKVQVDIFPDGGLSRVGLFEEDSLLSSLTDTFVPVEDSKCTRYSDAIPSTKKPLQLLYEPTPEEVAHNLSTLVVGKEFDAASLAFGGKLVSVTNQHYGPAAQVLSPFIPLSMHDGFECARSREPNHHEELVIQLSVPVKLQRVELDFTFFVNNNPREISMEGLSKSGKWVEMAALTPVKAYAGNAKVFQISDACPEVSQLRLKVFPDGGINRVRAYGIYPSPEVAL